jgi:hypothetical protein
MIGRSNSVDRYNAGMIRLICRSDGVAATSLASASLAAAASALGAREPLADEGRP